MSGITEYVGCTNERFTRSPVPMLNSCAVAIDSCFGLLVLPAAGNQVPVRGILCPAMSPDSAEIVGSEENALVFAAPSNIFWWKNKSNLRPER